MVDIQTLPSGDYLLPVRLASANNGADSSLIVDTDADTYYIIVRNTSEWYDSTIHKASWTALGSYSMSFDGAAQTNTNTIDSNTATYVGVAYGTPAIFDGGRVTEAKPQWWVIDLGENPNPAYGGNWKVNAARVTMRAGVSDGAARIYVSETNPTRGADGVDAPRATATNTDTGAMRNVITGSYKPLDDPAWSEPAASGPDAVTNMAGSVTIPFPEAKEGRYVMVYFVGGGENLAWAELDLELIK
jgi:hypothetical protein